jgi:hypothetical protein
MRRARFIASLTSFVTLILVFAPTALAGVRDHGGEGWYGETTDPVVTNMMFMCIAFFPVLIITFTLIQWFFDRRRHARVHAEAARRVSDDWKGGW